MDIELHGAGAGPQRGLEGRERVLWSAGRVSAMSDDLDVAQMAYSSELGPVWLLDGECRMDVVARARASRLGILLSEASGSASSTSRCIPPNV